MAGLVNLLYWCAVTVLLGGLLAFVLPIRRLWLILPVVPLFLPFYIPFFGEDVVRIIEAGLEFLLFVLIWTAGVFAGKRLRRSSRNVGRPPSVM